MPEPIVSSVKPARSSASLKLKTSLEKDKVQRQQQSSSSSGRVKRGLLKFGYSCSSLLNRLKFITEAVLDSDEITEELFNSTDSESSDDQQKLNLENFPHVTSTTPTTSALQPQNMTKTLEDKLSLDDSNASSTLNASSNVTTMNSSSDSSVDGATPPSASTKETKPFIGGEELWKLQNAEWLKPSSENATIEGKHKLHIKLQNQELKSYVLNKDYYIVYKNLVINNRNLKRPMNLKDLLKVVEAGWTWSKVFEKAAQGRQ